MPFYGRKRRDIVQQILECQFSFRGRRWRNISDQAKEFIRDLLVLDPNDRFSAEEALSATWLNRRFAATVRPADAEEEGFARVAMLRYAGYTKLKKMVSGDDGSILSILDYLVLLYSDIMLLRRGSKDILLTIHCPSDRNTSRH